MQTLTLTLAVAAVNVSLFALAVVTVAVRSFNDAGRARGLVAAVASLCLLSEVDGDEDGDEEEHVHGTHLEVFVVGWLGGSTDFYL
jgi:hypothetical protein